MAQGGGEAGGLGGSPMGASTGGMGNQSTPNMGGGMYNSTNSTTTQNMMGGGSNNAPMGQTLSQLGLFGFGGQQGGYGGGYGPMPQQGGFGPNANNFGALQGMGQIPEYASPFFQQMQQQPQSQQLSQLNQMMQGQPSQMPEVGSPYFQQIQQQQKQQQQQQQQQRRQQRREDRRKSVDFSQMGQAGQFGTQGFAQGLQDYAGQQYKDYSYNPTNQTFYRSGDKKAPGVSLDQMLQQGRAAGYKMANGGIAALRRKGK